MCAAQACPCAHQAHQFRARLYGLLYSGLVLATVFLTSIFNEQSVAYALVLNAPYMMCGSLVFLYFLQMFILYKGDQRRPRLRRASAYQPMIQDPALAELAREVELQIETSEAMLGWERQYLRRLVAGIGRNIDEEDAIECARQLQEVRDAEAAEAAAEATFWERVRGATRRSLSHASIWMSEQLSKVATRLIFGPGLGIGRLSTRLLSGIVMQLMISYNLAVFLCFQFAALAQDYLDTKWTEQVEALCIIGSISAAVLTYVIVFVQALITLRNFRRHVGLLRAGDYSFIPGGKKNKYDLNDTVGYMGFQVRPRLHHQA